ncbi:c-type cytochrome [Arenimonas daejeonensis]|uniref:c-type cytochrome n=1 Tax=Arenimonas daejeonensis TaxID=370777 RepID=UPI0013153F94|nr:c-type cytochrome [Arenimonas daejeonensis]
MNKWFKRSAWMVGFFLGAMTLLYAAAWAKTERALARQYTISDAPLQFRGDDAEQARGAHLYTVLGCVECHGEGGVGRVVFDAGPVARVTAPNLTPAAVAGRYSADQLAAAIRHGVGPDGRPLRFMPVGDFKNLSDADTAALVAHLQRLPSSDNSPAPFEVRPLGRVLYAIGKLELVPAEDLDHAPRVRISPPQGPNADYGAYLAQTCTGCHGQDLAGQRVPGTPPELPEAANLTPHANGLQGWTEADFVKVIRQGVRPDGRELHGFMPWKVYASMTDDELRAIWLHLSSLPPEPGAGKS